MVEVRKATVKDLDGLCKLAFMLWPSHTLGALMDEFKLELLARDSAFFVVVIQEKAIGFAQVSIRTDYVEGTQSTPVGYLEGIFMERAYRGNGYARKLVEVAEAWAWTRGCTEFASDCVFENKTSISFHQKVGFKECAKIVAFSKKIAKPRLTPSTNITGVYQHFKGKQYEVLGVGVDQQNDESFVLYQQLYEPFHFWIRPYDMFFEATMHQGKSVPRFQKIKAKYVYAPITPTSRIFHSEDETEYQQVGYNNLVYTVAKMNS